MSQSLVRVSVLADRRRVDVCLPAEIAVLQILPELGRGLGMESAQPGSSPRLVTVHGASLDPEQGLRVQGVSDGEILTLVADGEYTPPRVHDDLVEAVHERSRSQFRGWTAESSQMATDAVALGAGLLGVGLLGVELFASTGASEVTVLVATVAALLMGLLALGSCRGASSSFRQIGLVWLATLYAGVAAGLVAAHLEGGQHRLVAAAAGVIVMVMACLAVDPAHWPLLTPPAVLALALLVARTGAGLIVADAWLLLFSGVVVAVLTARLVPGVVVETTVLRGQDVGQRVPASLGKQRTGSRRRVGGAPPRGVDLVALDRDLELAHSLVLALGVSASALMVAIVPFAVRSGAPAVGLLMVLATLRLLRLRRVRLMAHVVAGLIGWATVTTATGVAIWVEHPEWRVHLAVMCVGLLSLPACVGAQSDALRRGWWGDTMEVVLVVVVPTLLVLVWWPGWGT